VKPYPISLSHGSRLTSDVRLSSSRRRSSSLPSGSRCLSRGLPSSCHPPLLHLWGADGNSSSPDELRPARSGKGYMLSENLLQDNANTAPKAGERKHLALWRRLVPKPRHSIAWGTARHLRHHGDRLSKARVACLHGDKEKSLLLCSWTEASLRTVRLRAVSAAQEDGGGGDGSFQKRHQTPLQLDEVVRCSPPHDE
jgi:hypothetical protein